MPRRLQKKKQAIVESDDVDDSDVSVVKKTVAKKVAKKPVEVKVKKVRCSLIPIARFFAQDITDMLLGMPQAKKVVDSDDESELDVVSPPKPRAARGGGAAEKSAYVVDLDSDEDAIDDGDDAESDFEESD